MNSKLIFRALVATYLVFSFTRLSIAEEDSPVTEPTSEASSGDLGEILFFPDLQERPAEDRHEIKPGQTLSLCLKIKSSQHTMLRDLRQEATGFKLLLEDEQEIPNILTIETQSAQAMPEDENACRTEYFVIPKNTRSGIYRIADLIIKNKQGRYFSLRQYLYSFSKADELEVKTEVLPPIELLKIEPYGPKQRRQTRYASVRRIRIDQKFTFTQAESFGAKNSLRVFYQLYEDGEEKNLYETRCQKKVRESGVYFCPMKLTRPKPEWHDMTLELEIHSIELTDPEGNVTTFQDPGLFKLKAENGEIRFLFKPIVKK